MATKDIYSPWYKKGAMKMRINFPSEYIQALAMCFLILMASSCRSNNTAPSATPANLVSGTSTVGIPQYPNSIEYLAHDGTPRTASLTTIDSSYFLIPTGTKDPDWIVYHADGTRPQEKYVTILATDFTARRMWLECYKAGNNKKVKCEFKNSDINGNDERRREEQIFLLDRYRNPFKLTIPLMQGEPPFQPIFSKE